MKSEKLFLRVTSIAVLCAVIVLSLCCAPLLCSAAELVGKDPYPTQDDVSPFFGEYADAVYSDGYTPRKINAGMSSWEIYCAMSDNFRNTAQTAQLATTISDIQITMTTPAFLIISKGTKLGVVQVSSLITANDAYGNTYYQAISQMETLGDDLSYLNALVPNFGM